MTSHTPETSCHRDGRLIVTSLGTDVIRAINHCIKEAFRHDKANNSVATPPSLVTDAFTVYDLETGLFHLICMHRLDYRTRRFPSVDNVVVFSEPAYAVTSAEKLQLATPVYYRRENLKPGISDPRDGTLTKDATGWASKIEPGVGGIRATVSFSSSAEPWVYCAAHYRSKRELDQLKNCFADKYDYKSATGITDLDCFAMWLAIDFALTFDSEKDVTLDILDKLVYTKNQHSTNMRQGESPINTVVHIHHGPVHYEDVSGRIDALDQWIDPNAGPKAWFTKETSFTSQSEYRFAVSTFGKPVEPKHYITVSQELRALTHSL